MKNVYCNALRRSVKEEIKWTCFWKMKTVSILYTYLSRSLFRRQLMRGESSIRLSSTTTTTITISTWTLWSKRFGETMWSKLILVVFVFNVYVEILIVFYIVHKSTIAFISWIEYWGCNLFEEILESSSGKIERGRVLSIRHQYTPSEYGNNISEKRTHLRLWGIKWQVSCYSNLKLFVCPERNSTT